MRSTCTYFYITEYYLLTILLEHPELEALVELVALQLPQLQQLLLSTVHLVQQLHYLMNKNLKNDNMRKKHSQTVDSFNSIKKFFQITMVLYLGLLSCMQKNKDENVYPTELILLILARVNTRIKPLLCTIFRAKNDAFNQPNEHTWV